MGQWFSYLWCQPVHRLFEPAIFGSLTPQSRACLVSQAAPPPQPQAILPRIPISLLLLVLLVLCGMRCGGSRGSKAWPCSLRCTVHSGQRMSPSQHRSCRCRWHLLASRHSCPTRPCTCDQSVLWVLQMYPFGAMDWWSSPHHALAHPDLSCATPFFAVPFAAPRYFPTPYWHPSVLNGDPFNVKADYMPAL